ncbi:MAG: alcohol dehydrogenase catalytic domain-containing protein [Caldilineaceae bacterium]
MVKVHVAPMCTEYKAFAEGRNHDHFGHEAAGEVVEVAQPGSVQVGDRVVVMPTNPCGKCVYCLDGDYIHCQDGVDFAAFHGSRHGSARWRNTWSNRTGCSSRSPMMSPTNTPAWPVAVWGRRLGVPTHAGGQTRHCADHGVGASGAGWGDQCALPRGAGDRCGIEPVAGGTGAGTGRRAIVDPRDEDALKQVLGGRTTGAADKAVDCSGSPAAHRLCIDATRRRGQVAFVGESSADTPLASAPT